MGRAAILFRRYRMVLLALGASAALHAAVMIGMPKRIEAIDDRPAAIYSASLDEMSATVDNAPASVSPPSPRPPRAARAKRAPKPLPAPEVLPQEDVTPQPPAEPAAVVAAEAEQAPSPSPAPVVPEPPPDVVALAQPAVPVPALEPEKFPVAALPESLSIDYQLTSAFADARATYRWQREGDSYRITGEASAVGFFTLFLEGSIVQESRGTVTASGLRPERFSESRPGAPSEGLEFDWPGRKVTFDRKGERITTDLADNTVDWLTMIFQLAHSPPREGTSQLRVFTQRKLLTYDLVVLGEETIDIPIGAVRALHLRHVDPKDATQVVDVWLGVEQHYLPVKLRYPVARNRLTVEQVATRVTSR